MPVDRSSADLDRQIDALSRHPYIQELRNSRLALVLSGGGAKGAYQAGCLEMLGRLGLEKFHVVVGTSTGAINGAAVASGKQRELVDLWLGINFFRIALPSPRALPYAILAF